MITYVTKRAYTLTCGKCRKTWTISHAVPDTMFCPHCSHADTPVSVDGSGPGSNAGGICACGHSHSLHHPEGGCMAPNCTCTRRKKEPEFNVQGVMTGRFYGGGK